MSADASRSRYDRTTTARYLRQRETEGERLLWERLRAHRLDGHKFRRQHPIGGFVVDFYCARARLIVEVDGGVHWTRTAADASRDDALRRDGYRILRLPDSLVRDDLASALQRVRVAIAAPPASPSPSSSAIDGEGTGG